MGQRVGLCGKGSPAGRRATTGCRAPGCGVPFVVPPGLLHNRRHSAAGLAQDYVNMTILHEKLCTPPNRAKVIVDCARLIDDEVDKKGGLSGLLIKGAFKTVKAVKHGFIEETIDNLLDRWVEKLTDHHARWAAGGAAGSFGAFCGRDTGGVAEKLLEVTDERAKRVDNKTIVALYNKLRPSAKDHVVSAVPGLGRVVDKYL